MVKPAVSGPVAVTLVVASAVAVTPTPVAAVTLTVHSQGFA